jgi:hypothetical protein
MVERRLFQSRAECVASALLAQARAFLPLLVGNCHKNFRRKAEEKLGCGQLLSF